MSLFNCHFSFLGFIFSFTMKLVIVESPTKAKTISRFLGKDYVIRASMGHVMDLPKSKLGIDVEHDFLPQYEMVADRKDILSELKMLAKTADSIILATDPDREGEAIASHIKDALNLSEKLSTQKNSRAGKVKNAPKGDKFKRIVFHEITQEAIEEAFKQPRELDEDLVNAQIARRVLDRLVGYKLSPILWQKIRRGLSAGRVQSVALRLIAEREKEITKFAKENYWTITALLQRGKAGSVRSKVKDEGTEFALIEINGEKIDISQTHKLYDGDYKVSKTTIDTAKKARDIVNDLSTKLFIVADVLKKQTKRSPQPPFTTSTLQQEAARRFGFSGKRTMSLAQKLYEEGFITYHRTDSVHLAASAVTKMRAYIKKEFGDKYLPEKNRYYSAKQKLAQEAHEAIRPTDMYRSAGVTNERLGPAYGKLYELIWRRAIASQMSDAQIESTTVFVDSQISNVKFQKANETKGNTYRFKTNGSILVFDGFLKVNPFGLQDRTLPDFQSKEELDLAEALSVAHETPPPPRYNDASLISSLEEGGIGRPSTYASIISTLEDRQYVEKAQGRFTPTHVGVAVNDFLVQHFSTIDDIPFTAQIEDELDQVAKGEKQWVPMMRNFYTPFEKKLTTVKEAGRVKIEVEELEEKCPKDGAPLVIRVGRFGKFISCKNFPACDFKKAFIMEANLPCPKDGDPGKLPADRQQPGRIVVKRTRKGRTFYGCSNYPKCDFAVWKLQDIGKEPKTEKKEVKKKTLRKEN